MVKTVEWETELSAVCRSPQLFRDGTISIGGNKGEGPEIRGRLGVI
jgi:hypothetical protein